MTAVPSGPATVSPKRKSCRGAGDKFGGRDEDEQYARNCGFPETAFVAPLSKQTPLNFARLFEACRISKGKLSEMKASAGTLFLS
mmetsp:Transcript_7751/g.20299  ORF Transcript_7751/g.20299 Transcript_7751/m.20299 type:complete len:85 (+) Transcript_7751:3955-4209(+)